MGVVVDLHHIGERNLVVLLRSGKAGMSEQFLNGPEVGAVAQKMGSESVAQSVGMNGRIACNKGGVKLDDIARAAVCEAPAAVIEEERLRLCSQSGNQCANPEILIQRSGG